MTTTTHFTDTTLVEMRIVKAKPECIWHLLHQAENLRRLYEKSGVKVLAIWMTTAGATHEMITLVQHASCASRAQYKDFRMTDTEWVKFDITLAKFFTEVEDYVCKTSVNMPTLPVIDPKKKYLIQMIRNKGFLPFDSKKLYDAIKERETVEGENACHAVTILVPMMSKHQCLIVLREYPEDNRADTHLNAYRDFVHDAKNWAHSHDTAQHVARERNVLVRPIPTERVALNASLE